MNPSSGSHAPCCLDHSCDECGWCTGTLNGGVPICCLTLDTGNVLISAGHREDLEILRRAIAADESHTTTLAGLIRDEVSALHIRRLLDGAQERVGARWVPNAQPATAADQVRRHSLEQPALPPASSNPTDFLTRRPHERKGTR